MVVVNVNYILKLGIYYFFCVLQFWPRAYLHILKRGQAGPCVLYLGIKKTGSFGQIFLIIVILLQHASYVTTY